MAIPLVLNCGYTHDGCWEWKCLSCYQSWEGRTSNFIYCPWCGIKFQGQQINQKQERLARQPLMKSPRANFLWVIEYRTRYLEDTQWSKWQRAHVYHGDSPASEILKVKKRVAHHESLGCVIKEVEVRVRTEPHRENDYEYKYILTKSTS